ncbi:hypothetical protein [Vulcanisaeta souniana]|nr:hypothetical protein [Vulcanisaeta souniana]
MNSLDTINEALVLIGRARMNRTNCRETLDALWELLINLDFELRHNHDMPISYALVN